MCANLEGTFYAYAEEATDHGQFTENGNGTSKTTVSYASNETFSKVERPYGKTANEVIHYSNQGASDQIRPNGLLAKLGLPCQNQSNYEYDQCYSFYANGCYNTCQFVKSGDIEDFMNNEKRKEKSRDAARSRRSRETEIFTDLGSVLPISSEQVSQLDKASVMRLAISYLKVRDMIEMISVLPVKDKLYKHLKEESAFLKSLDGFILVLSSDGDFIYLSENVSEYLGITQIDLLGQNVYEYSHPCDHEEIKETLNAKGHDNSSKIPKSIFIRFKCTLTSKGRSVNLKSASYKVIHCTGHTVKDSSDDDLKGKISSYLVAVGQPIPHPSNIDTPLPRQTFLTKHSLDMKFTHADDEFMLDILGYTSDDLIGKSVYEYHHAMDSDSIGSAYKCLFSKGQCETNRYRFLAKTGGYVWVVTQATLILDKMQKPQSVVCVNYVIRRKFCFSFKFRIPLIGNIAVAFKQAPQRCIVGETTRHYVKIHRQPIDYHGVECKHEIYASHQLACVKLETAQEPQQVVPVPQVLAPAKIHVEAAPDDNKANKKPAQDNKTSSSTTSTVKLSLSSPISKTKPISVTSKLFPSLDEPPRKEYPEAVSRPHAATKTIFAPRTEDMSKGFLTFSEEEPGLTMLKDEPDDLTHLAPVAGDVCVPLDDHPFLTDMLDDFLLKDNSFGPLLTDEPSDPFISYRDIRDCSPQLLSPNLSKNSDCSLPSLSSPNSSLLDEDQMSTFMNLQMEDDPDMIMKTPYMPMNFSDDLPLLMSNDLMWNTNEKSKNGTRLTDNSSTLAQMLGSSVNKRCLKGTDRGGGGTVEETNTDIYNDKSSPTRSWRSKLSPKLEMDSLAQIDRSPNLKRSNNSNYDHQTKRVKNEPKEKMSSELLHQLISNNQQRGRPKNKGNWLMETGGKAACISQPSDSVLMNLLDNRNGTLTDSLPVTSQIETKLDPKFELNNLSFSDRNKILQQKHEARYKREEENRKNTIRKNSLSLLDPETISVPSLLDLTQQDFEVNAPVDSSLLQGEELLIALEIPQNI